MTTFENCISYHKCCWICKDVMQKKTSDWMKHCHFQVKNLASNCFKTNVFTLDHAENLSWRTSFSFDQLQNSMIDFYLCRHNAFSCKPISTKFLYFVDTQSTLCHIV